MKKIVVFGRKDALETKIVHKFLEERTITFTSIIENKKENFNKNENSIFFWNKLKNILNSGKFKPLSIFSFFTIQLLLEEVIFNNSKIKKSLISPYANKKISSDFITSDINNLETINFLKKNNFDYALLAGVGIVNSDVLNSIKKFTLNAHPGPLPECRGSAALEFTLLKKLIPSVSIHIVTPEIDAGEIIGARKLELEKNDSFQSIYLRLSILCGQILVEILEDIISGKPITFLPNNGKTNIWLDASELVQKRARKNLKDLLAAL